MSLLTLIQKGGLRRVATATTATFATFDGGKVANVAPVANVAVASIRREDVELAHPSISADSWFWIEERSAIMEIDGGLTREQADHQAFLCWFLRFVGPPEK